jgi:hypothetical protein
MNIVLSFVKWNKLNEQTSSTTTGAAASKSTSKTPTSSSSKTPMKGGSSSSSGTNSVTTKPVTTTKPVSKPVTTTKPVSKPVTTTKPVSKPVTTTKPVSKPVTTTKPTVTTKPAATTNYSSTAIQISDKISNLFSDTNFWAKFKGTINDDEDSALVAFNNWWNSSIRPMLSKLPSTDPNAQTIIRTQPLIQKALLGSSSSDTVSWTIRGAQGMSKAYSVDTDF